MTDYVAHFWTPGYRPTKRNQVVIHRADCPLRGEGSVPVPTLLLPHLAWEKDVVYPHRACCPDLRQMVNEDAEPPAAGDCRIYGHNYDDGRPIGSRAWPSPSSWDTAPRRAVCVRCGVVKQSDGKGRVWWTFPANYGQQP